MKKVLLTIMTVSLCLAVFAGCSNTGTAEQSPETSTAVTTKEVVSVSQDEMFTDRDKEIGYSEADSVRISLSDGASTADSDSVIINGDKITITAEGTYIVSGSLTDGQLVVEAAKTDKLQIVLDNASISCASSAALYIKQADKVFVTTANGSDNSLTTTGAFVAIDDNNIDAALFSKEDLTLNGAGSLTVVCNYGHGIVSKDDLVFTGGSYSINANSHGVTGKDSIRIADGDFTINSGKDAIHSENSDDETLGFVYIAGGSFEITAGTDGVSAQTTLTANGGSFSMTTGGGSANASVSSNGQENKGWGAWGDTSTTTSTTESQSAKGLKAGGDLTVSGGDFNIDSSDDAVHSNSGITISGGVLNISSGDDGIHADAHVSISGDTVITIAKSYEGIEGQSIEISGGVISLVASDDGLNVAGGNDGSGLARPGQGTFDSDSSCYIIISGGELRINASGDGIDSNGNLTITGGYTIVSGPVDGGNGALDYEGTATISGGVLLAAGSSGMAVGFAESSAQPSIMYTLSSQQSAGTVVVIKDSSGKTLAEFTPEKQFQTLNISLTELKVGETYTITVGGVSYEVQLSANTYSNGGAGNMGGMGGQNGGMTQPNDANRPAR